MPADQDKIATLRQAAAAKREAATARAETGIRKLTKTGQPVTFRGVAAASGVSVDFLYRHPELRARIERLRGRQPAPAGRAPASEPGIQRRRHLDGQAGRAAPRAGRDQGPARDRPRRAARAAQAPWQRRSRRRIQPPAVRDDATLKTRHQRCDLAIHTS